MSGTENEKSILLTWLQLLGWQVDIGRDGNSIVGVARHCGADGSTYRVGGCAPTREELALQLFEAVMKIVESRRRRGNPLLAA
jgi:hypothetical protein